MSDTTRRGRKTRKRNTPASKAKREIRPASAHFDFILGASWAYQELTGALIVPASFEEAARAALEGK